MEVAPGSGASPELGEDPRRPDGPMAMQPRRSGIMPPEDQQRASAAYARPGLFDWGSLEQAQRERDEEDPVGQEGAEAPEAKGMASSPGEQSGPVKQEGGSETKGPGGKGDEGQGVAVPEAQPGPAGAARRFGDWKTATGWNDRPRQAGAAGSSGDGTAESG
eukprot:10423640-Heterocapsa_arctica.AAC.1